MSDPPTDKTLDQDYTEWPESSTPQVVVDRVSNRAFNKWNAEQQFQNNILEGKAYFNGPSPEKPPERHSPSQLLQCHRKASYARKNAPREGTPPEGLFWIGSEFEEQVIVPFLQDVATTEDTYVTNSVWIDAEIPVANTTLRIRGSTDPVIVNADAEPLFVTEIKTTKSLDHLDKPKQNHKAQLHAYLYALNDEYDHGVTNGMIVYGCRTTLDIEVFTVAFDREFWENTVIPWLEAQTSYEEAGELPPATPERDWECSYCSFKHRCGEADTPYADVGYDGLLPLFTGYDRQNLLDYLKAYEDADARLTPTLAHQFPDLAREYGAYEWGCPGCGATYSWDTLEWDGNTDSPPVCPRCAESGELLTVSGPEPNDQLSLSNKDD
ncbi:PD-(D/E)XK nuclease family protein [Halorubrum sp. AD140]|uniref:CRISPR-associated protein Cas4 n=1 Tax=Halorubrum sp. AD140 TaxID=3050073 RepID=UPI002ACCE079|nr:PD-(D/E)XK nuclease family protein [Halorubrum sp. AD140]MDZ5811535.1 PD-(D/E)XK nuclease family protein [Halorubrum sp. AD140]